MSFKKRALTVRISLQRGEKFSNGSDELALTGYRAEAVIENVGAESNAAGVMNLRIYGMRLEDMLVLSTGGLKTDTVRNDFIILSAGNEGEVIRQIFAGSIINAFIDFNGAPDVAFNVMAASGWVDRIKPEAANSYKGQVDVAQAIEAIATKAGYEFKNEQNVTAQLANQYVWGSAIDQIIQLCNYSKTKYSIENNTIAIWPEGKPKDKVITKVSKETGMIGYPTFIPGAMVIRSEFNPDLEFGRMIEVDSIINIANNKFGIIKCNHELSTLQKGGPWFTTLTVVRDLFVE